MNIVVLDGYALNPGDLHWNDLERLGNVTIYDRTARSEIIARSLNAEILLTNKTDLNKEIISGLKNLKYIGVLATGYNVVDIEAAKASNIIVTNIPAYSTDSVAQMVFALILEFCNNVRVHSESVHAGEWTNSIDFSYWKHPLTELSGKTLGIIGFGSIGRKVASIASAFGMKVLVHSRTMPAVFDFQKESFVDLHSLICNSDFLTIHCPLTEKTRGMVDRDFLGKMKASAILINTARGPIVNEEDLAEALNNDIIAGAGLDVLSTEPPSAGNPLLKAKNCIITPHISWASKEARTRLLKIAAENIEDFLNNKIQNSVV